MKDRDSIIDWMRGFGILCVIFGHTFALNDGLLRQFLFSFHMPLFFFLSGLVYKHKGALPQLVKFASLYVFFLLLSLVKIVVAPASFFSGMSSLPIGLWSVFVGGQPWFNAPLWFLVVMCLTSILFTVYLRLLSRLNRHVRIVIAICVFAVLIFLTTKLALLPEAYRNSIVPYKVTSEPAAFVYFGIGYYGRDLFMRLEKLQLTSLLDIFIAILFGILLLLELPLIGQVNYRVAQVGSVFAFPVALTGICMVLFLARGVKCRILVGGGMLVDILWPSLQWNQ